MDRFKIIQSNVNPSNYFSFGSDMYGVKTKLPAHAFRSLYSSAPIYYGDYGYGYPPFQYPPSGGVFAAEGDEATEVVEEVEEETSESPEGVNASENAQTAKLLVDYNTTIVIAGIIGGVAGHIVAKRDDKNPVMGALIGSALLVGAMIIGKKRQ